MSGPQPEPATPDLPPYDLERLRSAPMAERLRLLCRTWVYGIHATPVPVYIGYVLKIALFYAGGWWLWCSFSPGMGSIAGFTEWATTPVAFQKAMIWSLLYESLGFGCSSGPMTGRFVPPIGGVLWFARPGTTKLPLVAGLPVFGGIQRSLLDVGLYLAYVAVCLWALASAAPPMAAIGLIVVLVAVLGVTDKTIFLAARSEHYWVVLTAMALASGTEVWIGASKWVWAAIWFWAATSKLNSHFPGVIAIMLTNSPFIPRALAHRLWQRFPDDLRASPLAAAMAHGGTVAEYAIPVILMTSDGGWQTVGGLILMLGFHSFISGNLPMGMPVEWNVAMVYGGFTLFGAHAAVSPMPALENPVLAIFLGVMLVAIPLVGNFMPRLVSFLMSMRYYAGNWAYSVWLFRGDATAKLGKLVKSGATMREQLERLVDDAEQVERALMMTPTFRLMHLQGRALHDALPHALEDAAPIDGRPATLEDYEWLDGELVAGIVLGWNFGDGHLHGRQLLEAVQAQCGFEPDELRVVCVESQPMAGEGMDWTVYDAARGEITHGRARIADMLTWQPWPQAGWPEAAPERS
jgi:hypothetical protein